MWKTIEDLKDEKKAYQKRGSKAWTKLQKLPTNFVDYKEYKKREVKRSALQTEVNAVKQIIKYIEEAIDREMRNATVQK